MKLWEGTYSQYKGSSETMYGWERYDWGFSQTQLPSTNNSGYLSIVYTGSGIDGNYVALGANNTIIYCSVPK